MLISFSGNNGSGKTRLSIFLRNKLRNSGKEVIYIREFKYLIIGRIKKMLGRRTSKIQREVIKKRKKNLFAYILPYVVWADYFIYFNYLRLLKSHKFIIVDRYTYDYLNTWEELSVSNRFVRRLYDFLPKSDISFYIDVAPEAAFKRFIKREKEKKMLKDSPRPNLTIDFYKRNRRIYSRVLKGQRPITIDGNKTIVQCEREILEKFKKSTGVKI